jgi:hypothetical protein
MSQCNRREMNKLVTTYFVCGCVWGILCEQVFFFALQIQKVKNIPLWERGALQITIT